MKKIILILTIFISLKIIAQPAGYTGLNMNYQFNNFYPKRGIHVPAFSGTPTLGVGQFTAAGAVGVDSVLNKFYFYSGGTWREAGSAVVTTTLPIIGKAAVPNGLTINLPFVQDGGASANLGTFNFLKISNNTLLSDFLDGIIAFNQGDSAIIVAGGWNTTPLTTDTIRISKDGGQTFTFKSRFNYNVHTIGHFQSVDGFYYFFGGDYLNTSTQQKTVTRTSDFVTFDTRTTNAEFGSRILAAAWEWNGSLFVGGGQSDLAGTIVYNDIWKSDNGGTNWTLWQGSAMASNGDSVMRGNAYNTVVVFNRALYKITSAIYPAVNKKCYKSLDGGHSWVRISDYPFPLGVSYPASIVWDGKLWVFGGHDGTANTANIGFIDKLDSFHINPNYVNDNPANIVDVTHASDLVVYKDHLVYPLGNAKNSVFSFFRSNYVQTFTVRDSAKFVNFKTPIVGDTTNFKPAVANTITGKIEALTAWRTIAPNGFGMAIGNLIQNGPVTGEILFVGGANQLDQSNNLIYDSTLVRLGVGTGGTTPAAPFHAKRSTSGEVGRFESSSGAGAVGFDGNGMYLQPITSSMGTWIYNNAGTTILKVLGGGGIEAQGSFQIDGQGAITSATSGIANSETKILSSDVSMPASRLIAGTCFEVVLHGTCTSTAAGAGTVNVRYGTLGTTSDGLLQSFTLDGAQTSGTNIPFMIRIIITIKTTGASATSDGGLELINQGTTGLSTTATQVKRGTATNINTTTNATFFTVSYQSGNANTTSTFQDAVITFLHK